MKGFLRLLPISLILLLPVVAYSEDSNSGKTPPSSSGKVAAPSPTESVLTGKIVETMNSGDYTYINLEKDGKRVWVAVPKMKVKVGQEISLYPGMAMGEFTSKTLNRTFSNIIFSPGPVSEVSNQDETLKEAHAGRSEQDTPKEKIKVKKASGPDAYTVGELYKKRDSLDKKHVVVKGKVVKVSRSIMGKNWIHLQDGSGNSADHSDQLVVTSQDLPAVGDTVTASGTLYKDKDFGAGYRYAVIIDGAGITK